MCTKMGMIILRGIPGSGKSTLCKKIKDCWPYYSFSTDNYWIRPDGFYDFNGKLLTQAHSWNLECVKNHTNSNYIIVDNVNSQLKEFREYIDLAVYKKIPIQFAEPNTPWKFDVEECSKRNTHSVPKETIQRILDRWETTDEIIAKLAKEGIKCSIYQEQS